ncbi:MAG: PKD domain-containing protein [Bacteroidetes bacterium]|nr:PKD domain-containing protein [Bacteroidota bacterium]
MFLTSLELYGQGNKLNIQASVPKNMSVCGFDDTSLISVYNISSSVVNSIKVTLILPAGVKYVSGSVTGTGVAESNITNLNKPVFSAPSLLLAQNFKFRVKLVADCDIIPLLGGSSSPQIDVRVDYTGNFDLGSSNPFVPVIPSPGFASITNSSFIGNVGDKFIRKVTITNYGKGPMKTLRFMRINGKDISCKPQSGLNHKISGDTIYTFFVAGDISKIGDKDTLLEQNESLIISDTFTINGCNKISTYYEIGWGCDNKICQIVKNNAGVTISGDNPNVIVWPSYTDKYCYDGATKSPQMLTLTNTGKKDAKDLTAVIYVGTAYSNSYFDTGAIYGKLGSKGSSKRLNMDSTAKVYYPISCVSANSTGYMRIKLGTLAPGDTFFLNWEMTRCALATCNSAFYDLSWIYYVTYKNQCNAVTTSQAAWGKVYAYSGGTVSMWVPTDLARDEIKDFKFTFNSFYNLPMTNTGKIYIDLVLPKTLDHSLNKNDFFIDNGALTSTWYPDSVVRRKDTLRAFLGNVFKFGLTSAELTVKLKGICTSYSGNTGLPVYFSLYYNTQTSCNLNPWIRPICASFITKVHCSNSCNGGMWFKNFQANRVSFGLPDNDNNGLADGSGTLNMAKVRKERVMVGDTIETVFTGRPKNASGINNWRYGYAESYIAYGNYLDVIDAKLIVYKGITLQSGTCNTVRIKKIISGGNATFKFDFTVDSIYPKGCLSSSYRFTQNDSIMLVVRYRVSQNVSGAAVQLNFNNRFYFGSVANPSKSQSYQCDTFGANMLMYGYYYANCCSDNIVYSNCAEVTLSQSWYLGMGPCCVNYAGNNLFPYEFRNYTKIKALRIHLPSGLKLVNTYFGQYRTTGVGSYLLENVSGIPVKKGTTNPLVFEFGKYYKDSGGTINPGDDGVQGYFTYTVQPRCNLPANTPIRIDYDYIFERKGTLGTGYDTVKTGSYDLFTFNPPVLSLQPAVSTVYATSDTAEWEVRYANPSAGFNAYNIWLSPKTSSNIRVVEIRDMDKDTIIKPVKDIFRAGNLGAGKVRRFKIRAVYNDCNPDSLIVYGSYNCAEYPVDFADYPCTPNKAVLYLEPQNTRLQLTLTDSANVLDLCATNKMNLLVENIQSVTVYNTKIRVNLPIGMQVVSGSSFLKYPLKNAAVSLGLPKLVSGTIYEWDLAALSAKVKSGFKGTTDTSANKLEITFRVTTNCDYASGSFVSARALANIKCGNPVPAVPAYSDPLEIKGVTRPYYTLLKSWADTLLPCQKPMYIKTRVIFLGPGKSGAKDLVEIFLPNGVDLDTSYWNSVRNAPSKDSITKNIINGAQLLSWKMPSGITPGDSMEFHIRANGESDLLTCGNLDIISRAVVVQPVVCVSTGNACDIKVITGGELVTPIVDKGNVQIEAIAANTKILNSDSEEMNLLFRVVNYGRYISSNDPFIIRYHYDKNNSGKWDAADPFIDADTFYQNLDNGKFFIVNRKLKISAGQSCGILAVLDSAACSCMFGQRLFAAPALQNAGRDTAICSAENLEIGIQSVKNFSYTWNNDQVLSDIHVANPKFIATNQSGNSESYKLILTTNRGACLSKDTVDIVINPLPFIHISNSDTQVCEGRPVLLKSNISGGNGSNKILWKPSLGIPDSSLQNVVVKAYKSQTYYVNVTDIKKCSTTDSVSILVHPYPVANFTWPATCFGQDVWLTDSSEISSGTLGLRVWKTSLYDTFGVTKVKFNFGNNASLAATLIVESNKGCADTITKTVALKPLPVAKFSAGKICFPDSVHFINNTTWSSGNIKNWSWNFGDGDISGSTNPVKKYKNFGIYNVTFVATSDFGCTDTFRDVATVYPKPEAVFDVGPVCERDSLKFTNQSNLFGDTLRSYVWDLGALGSYTQSDPNVYASVFGTYKSLLYAESIHGCRDTFQKNAIVYAVPVSGFISSDVCLNQNLILSDSSSIKSGTVNMHWFYLGDGSLVNAKTVSKMYATSGIYTIKLVVQSDKGCRDSISRDVQIFPLAKPYFNILNHCQGDSFHSIANYYGGGNPISFKWFTGDGDSALMRNLDHWYKKEGKYAIQLKIVTDKGCKSDTLGYVDVFPKPEIKIDAINPCNDDSISLKSVTTISSGTISSYLWKFSDGYTANTQNINRKYAPAGNYGLYLEETSDKNCRDTALGNIVVNNPVKVDFDASDACLTENTIFTNKTFSVEPVTRHIWNFGNGNSAATKDAIYMYNAAGTYNVTLLEETIPGCVYGANKDIVVHPPPNSSFITNPSVGTIVNPNIQITDLSSGADTIWYYTSDGYRNGNRDFLRAFPDSGSFRIWQVAKTKYNCMDSSSHDIYINFMYTLHVPTSFTPNGDEKNEFFEPGGMGIQWYSMRIYSRWGELIYITESSKPWDGKMEGMNVPDGVYAVLINIRDYKGFKHYYQGSITVLH